MVGSTTSTADHQLAELVKIAETSRKRSLVKVLVE
jgi:hypothetical protein